MAQFVYHFFTSFKAMQKAYRYGHLPISKAYVTYFNPLRLLQCSCLLLKL